MPNFLIDDYEREPRWGEVGEQRRKEREREEKNIKIIKAIKNKIISLNNLNRNTEDVFYYIRDIGNCKVLSETSKAIRIQVLNSPDFDSGYFAWIPKSCIMLFKDISVKDLNTFKKIKLLKKLPSENDKGNIFVKRNFAKTLIQQIKQEKKEKEEFEAWEKSGGKYYI